MFTITGTSSNERCKTKNRVWGLTVVPKVQHACTNEMTKLTTKRNTSSLSDNTSTGFGKGLCKYLKFHKMGCITATEECQAASYSCPLTEAATELQGGGGGRYNRFT